MTIDKIIAKFKVGSKPMSETYDDVGLAAHGQYDNKTKKWNGKISIGGPGVDRALVLAGFNGAYAGPGIKYLVYCGQTKSLDGLYSESGPGLEKIVIHMPKVSRKWTEKNDKGEDEKCYGLNFTPYHLSKTVTAEK